MISGSTAISRSNTSSAALRCLSSEILDEDVDLQAQLARVQQRDAAVDQAFGFEPPDPGQAGRGRQVDAGRQLDVGQARVALQFVQDTDVSGIQVDFQHKWLR